MKETSSVIQIHGTSLEATEMVAVLPSSDARRMKATVLMTQIVFQGWFVVAEIVQKEWVSEIALTAANFTLVHSTQVSRPILTFPTYDTLNRSKLPFFQSLLNKYFLLSNWL